MEQPLSCQFRASGYGTFAADTIQFLNAFQAYARRYAAGTQTCLTWNSGRVKAIRGYRSTPEVASALLHFPGGSRSVTLIVVIKDWLPKKGSASERQKSR